MAVDMFLKLTGINGESQDKTHKGEIDILAWSWGASQSGTMHMGQGGGSGKINVQDLSVTKYVDLSTTALLTNIANGSHITEAVLTVRKAGGTPLEYIIITMGEVIFTSLSTGGSGGEDRLTENVTLNFAKFKVKYTEQSATGSAGATPDMSWNIAQNTATY